MMICNHTINLYASQSLSHLSSNGNKWREEEGGELILWRLRLLMEEFI